MESEVSRESDLLHDQGIPGLELGWELLEGTGLLRQVPGGGSTTLNL